MHFRALELTGSGMAYARDLDSYPYKGSTEGFFHCGKGFHIPSYLINNGEKDCLTGNDEDIPMDRLHCPGYYRCHKTGNTVNFVS